VSRNRKRGGKEEKDIVVETELAARTHDMVRIKQVLVVVRTQAFTLRCCTAAILEAPTAK
jgi:hypothetical protein